MLFWTNGASICPIGAISIRTRSPLISQRGGCIPAAVPAGVPVLITSPGSRVMIADSSAICAAIEWIMVAVLAS